MYRFVVRLCGALCLAMVPALAYADSPSDPFPEDAALLILRLIQAGFLLTFLIGTPVLARYVYKTYGTRVILNPWNLLYLVVLGFMFALLNGSHSDPYWKIALGVIGVVPTVRLFFNIRATRPVIGTVVTIVQCVDCIPLYFIPITLLMLLFPPVPY